MANYILTAFDVLDHVFRDGAYSTIELNRKLKETEEDKAKITHIVYGVLEKNFELDRVIDVLCKKRPKGAALTLLKVGMYAVRYMDVPNYAVVNLTVEAAKQRGKQGVSGFINAVLKRSADVVLPPEKDEVSRLSREFGVPLWIVKRLYERFAEKTEGIFSFVPKTHVRFNLREDIKDVDAFCKTRGLSVSPSVLPFCRYAEGSVENCREYTCQSLSSVLAVLAMGIADGSSVLDVCSAPGGKAVFASELNQKGSVEAWDLHVHRVRLVNFYAGRMGAENLTASVCDATVFQPEKEGKFDFVLCDAPCSGLGVLGSRPDVRLNRKEEDIAKLASLQKQILENAARYVRKGGVLLYSTCTLLKEENEDVVEGFLKEHPEFVSERIQLPIEPFLIDDRSVTLLPTVNGTEGFFMARMRKI